MTDYLDQALADQLGPDPHPDPVLTPAERAVLAEAPGGSWLPQDLAEIVRGLQDGTLSRPAPTVGMFDADRALFYPGRVNGIHGDSNAGKTWTALTCCAQQIEVGEVVVYVDLEDDAAGVVSRLLDMGADPGHVLARFVYVGPSERLDNIARGLLAELLAERRPSLVVVDSTGEGLALDGANPNADEEVARWFRTVPRFIADQGPAVLVLDHAAKADDGGLWPIGSHRKRAAIDGAQYVQRVVRPFSRDTAGAAVLTCAKDRGGNYRAGQKVAELRVTPDADGVHVELVGAQDDHAGPGGAFRPTVLMERVSRHLEEFAGDAGQRTGYRVRQDVRGKTDGKLAALGCLVSEGFVREEPGQRGATVYTSVKPYREADDSGDRSTSPSTPVPVPVPKEGDRGTGQMTCPGDRSGTGGGQVADDAAEHTPSRVCSSCSTPLDGQPPGIRKCEPCTSGVLALIRREAAR